LELNHKTAHLIVAPELRISDLQKPKLAEEFTRKVINSFFQSQSVGAALSKQDNKLARRVIFSATDSSKVFASF
jgi:hypothetical protein